MGEFRAAKIKRDNSSSAKKSKRLGQHSFCDYLRRYYMAKKFEIEESSFKQGAESGRAFPRHGHARARPAGE